MVSYPLRLNILSLVAPYTSRPCRCGCERECARAQPPHRPATSVRFLLGPSVWPRVEFLAEDSLGTPRPPSICFCSLLIALRFSGWSICKLDNGRELLSARGDFVPRGLPRAASQSFLHGPRWLLAHLLGVLCTSGAGGRWGR